MAACAAAAGCATAPAPVAKAPETPPGFVADAKTPLDQYKVVIDRSPETVALSVHASGVSANQRAALEHFAERWRETGGADVITVQAPVNSVEPADSHVAAQGVAAVLNALGVPPSRLRLADYDARGAAGAPVYARYERYEAHGPDCTQGWSNLVATKSNKMSPHFGCAQAANLAAMVADPHDLARPAPSAPADSLRRAFILDKYRQGQVSSSQKDDQAQGTVSQSAN
ncbi:MAG: CpaD family pilus assembly protein [Caulobacteraceae bacterium]|nr:CpaD family pilus assembly protein [Caulobacter sp.]